MTHECPRQIVQPSRRQMSYLSCRMEELSNMADHLAHAQCGSGSDRGVLNRVGVTRYCNNITFVGNGVV